jgi:Protein of unknown function (DUF2914)
MSHFFHKNEKWLGPLVLFGGFILDNLSIRQSDLLPENLAMTIYFIMVAGSLLVWHAIDAKNTKTVALIEFQSILFLLIQFFFGGLFSFLTVFYIKSASFFASWPFLALLFGGMIATEYLKKHLYQFFVQLGTLYLLLFTYCIVIVPLFVHKISSGVFVISALVSLIIITLYILLFYRAVPSLLHHKQKYLITIIGTIFIIMNTFYFLNIIPPIPLALRDAGVYQSVTKKSSDYIFSNFQHGFSFKTLTEEYVVSPGSPAYFYSSIYAPGQFTEKITHQWQKKDAQGNWITVSSFSFSIYGGKSTGYRGYSINDLITPGYWRVLVKTQTGQVLGGKSFSVK